MEQRETINEITGNNEMTQELLQVEKKQFSMLRIMMIANVVLAAGLVLALLLVVPRLLTVASEAETALKEVNTLAGNAEKTLEGIDEVVENANTTVGSAGRVLEENAEKMEEALEHINGIDFEKLNDAIRDLAQAVEPLANLGRVFS